MKIKKTTLIIIVLMLVVSLIGCGTNDLETYMNAGRKTDEIQRGQMSYDIRVESEHNTEGLSQEEIKQLNYFKKIEAKTNVTFDEIENKVIARSYLNFGGMGFDMVYYINKDKTFIRMPIVGKYLNFDSFKANEDLEEMPIEEGTLKEIKEQWLQLLNSKDVVSGEKTLLNTEDGEVKVTRFVISPSEEQIRTFLNEVIEIVKGDARLRTLVEENIIVNYEEEKTYNEIIDEFKKSIEDIIIKDIKYEVLIDIDGYIIKSDIQVNMEVKNSKPGTINAQSLTIERMNWSIEKEQSFDFPVLNKDNTLETENIDQGVPFMFEDIFSSNSRKGDN